MIGASKGFVEFSVMFPPGESRSLEGRLFSATEDLTGSRSEEDSEYGEEISTSEWVEKRYKPVGEEEFVMSRRWPGTRVGNILKN
jgi:hypothetical protein